MTHTHLRSPSLARAHRTAVIFGSLWLGLLAGCSSGHTGVSLRRAGSAQVDVTGDPSKLPPPSISLQLSPNDKVRIRILPAATLAPGASVLVPHQRLSYAFTYQTGQYRILPGDQLGLRFASDPKLDFDPEVRPDGRISVGFVAVEIEAAGKTPVELAAAVEAATRARLNQPNVAVVVLKANLSAAELSGETTVQPDGDIVIPRIGRLHAAGLTSEALASELGRIATAQFKNPLVAQVIPRPATNGEPEAGLVNFDQQLEVSAGGILVLPELGAFDINHRTVPELQAAIEAALRPRYPNPLTVLVSLEASAARVVYIDGEVGRAGAYPLSPAITTLRAIALAGGVRETGDLRSVVVIHRETPQSVAVYVTNLEEFVKKAATGNDLALAPQDIVIVPRSGVAKANLWVDQYINRMLPFSRSVSYSYYNGSSRTEN